MNGQSRIYAYDFQSRMTSLTDTNGSVFAYAFDGEGNRVRQSLNDCLTTRFVYDGGNAVAEMNASNEVVWAWVNGPGLDQPVERIAFINGTARNRQIYHSEGLGSVSALTDESGEPVQTYAYAAFGGVRAQTGTDLNRVTFTAREAMGDSLGFFYYRNRAYDPNTGRFTSEDPLGFVDGANRYLYCGNNPICLVDPFGLAEFTREQLEKARNNYEFGQKVAFDSAKLGIRPQDTPTAKGKTLDIATPLNPGKESIRREFELAPKEIVLGTAAHIIGQLANSVDGLFLDKPGNIYNYWGMVEVWRHQRLLDQINMRLQGMPKESEKPSCN